jgi:hypothetical protein
MRSRILRPTILALLVLLLIAGSAPILAGADTPEQRATSGFSDLVNFGTGWVPQLKGAFGNKWKPYGWGIEASVKPARAPGYQWVHIPIPYMSVIESTAVKLDLVQFCARSSNGAATKPTDVHVWVDSNAGATRIAAQSITWANNNDKQCITVNLADAWYASLSLSVQLYFANSNDVITLYKAWARVVP